MDLALSLLGTINSITFCGSYLYCVANLKFLLVPHFFSKRLAYAVVRLMGRAASHITLECALQTHPNIAFIGEEVLSLYEGRCGLPTNFDATYCYALGYAAGALLHSGKTGLISSVTFITSLFYFKDIASGAAIDASYVGNLSAPVNEWTVGGTALTSLMDVERRHGIISLFDIFSL
ncbi:hypothetical protein BHM03_00046516 [Ensete ventricosum]|nr:hypothetical protein BHM03_00046516 [Ensete ventricosum]